MNGEGAMTVRPMILKSLACCSCQKIFNRRNNQEQRGRSPYLLNCGHSVCESCCQNVKTNVISCGACGALTQLSSVNNPTLSLSRNAYLEGRIWLGKNLLMMDNISYRIAMKHKNILQKNIGGNYLEDNLGSCYECSRAEATKACQQCGCNFCDPCWTRVHSSGKSLQKHVPTAKTALDWNDVEHCKVHKRKVLEFFCRECKVYACPNCIVLEHQGENHKPVTLQKRNTELFEDVDHLKQAVNQNMKRMVDTMAEVKALREEVPGSVGFYEDLQHQVVQNFVHLHGVLQVAEESVLKRLEAAENTKRNRVEEILLQLDRQIETVKVVLERVESLQNPENGQKDVLLERILETLTTLKNLPCRLVKSEEPGKGNKSSDKPMVSFDDSIIERLKNYCTLNIPTSDILELKSDCSDDVVFHFSQPPKPESVSFGCETAREDGVMSVSLQNSNCSDDTKKLVFSTYVIKSSNHPLSVLPVPKTKPLTMVEGQAYPVCISYVKDPGEFYVMRSSLRKQRAKIDVLAPTLAGRAQNPPTHIQKDEYYLVQYAADKKWYRGRVVDVLPRKNENNETVAVIYYLDYGNKQEVPLSRMRNMPKALSEEPPLAIKCKLFSCIPRNGTWCKGSTKVMLDVLDTSVMTMYVMKVLPDCLEVDLSKRGTDESLDREVVSLRDMMVFLEYASFAGGNDSKKKRANLKYLTPVLPDTEDTFHGLITYVESESMFYMQKIGPDTQHLLTLMDRLDNTYNKENMKGIIYNPDLDMPCAALYPQDGKWYRGEIIDIPGHEQLTVYYVDYGNKETVHWKSVRRLQPEFLKLVPQAIPCSLMEVPSAVNTKWRADVKDQLERFSSNILRVFVAGKKDGKLIVVLYTSKNVSVNEEVMEDATRKDDTQDCNEVKSNIADDGSMVEDDKNRKRKKGRKKESSTVDEPPPKESSDDVFRTEVNILQASSPSDIYVSLLCFSSRAKELEKELQEFYGKSEPESEAKWEVNDRCAAFSSKQEKWYRATIAEILDNDQMRVVFKDIMETEDLPASKIRKLDDRFFSYPIGAIKCHLSGIFPPETEWPGLTCEFLQSQLESYKHVYMTKMGEIDNNSLPIQLWVKKRTQGGALEPSMEEWVVLNDLIVQQGLAVPEKAKLIHHIISEEEFIPKDTDERTTPQIIDDIPLNVLDETEDSFIPSVTCDWPPPKPHRKDHFWGETTYVDFNAVLYIQDEEDKPTLDQMRASLLEYYDDSKPQAHDQYWSEGQLCIVKYCMDGGWYRGKIVKVNEDCTYKVLFVDYGNEEICRVTEMRKDVKHLDIPILARRYVVHGVSPVSDDGQWPSKVVDYIYGSLVEKRCNVTVVEESEDGIKPDKVRIKVSVEGYDVAEDLVKMELAKFDTLIETEKSTEKVEAVGQVPIQKSYSELILPEDCKSFPIEVLIVNDSNIIVHIADHDSISEEVRKVIFEFVTVTDEMQRVAELQENVRDFSRGVPCISLYSYNGTWYRAEVLHHDTERDLVLVRYIDYGNEEYVMKDSIRKCLTKWFNIPKMALNLKLYNVRKSEGVEKSEYVDSLTELLSQPGLTAEVVKGNGGVYFVEVKTEDGALAYQDMLDKGLMEYVQPTNWLDLIENFALD